MIEWTIPQIAGHMAIGVAVILLIGLGSRVVRSISDRDWRT